VVYDDTNHVLQSAPGFCDNCVFPGTGDAPSASGNTVTVDYVTGTGTADPDAVAGGIGVDGAVSDGNTVYFLDGKTGDVYGGDSRGASSTTATNNQVFIEGGQTTGSVYGGHSNSQSSNADAGGNAVSIKNTQVVTVYGGRADGEGDSTASNNQVLIDTSEVSGDVYGGYVTAVAYTANATENQVYITGSTVTGSVYGGYGDELSGTINVTGNQVLIENSHVAGDVYGGYANSDMEPDENVKDNQVSIKGSSMVSGSIYGEYDHSHHGGRDTTNNTLNLEPSSAMTVRGLKNFQHLNFTLPAGINNDPLLTVTGTDGLNYGVGGVTLDIRTLDSLGDKDYILLRTTDDTQAITDIETYSFYGHAFTGDGANRTLYLDTGRVRGTFSIEIEDDGKNLVLDVDAHDMPNAALTWTGTDDNLWGAYNPESPENWLGTDPHSSTPDTALQYLDGDTVRFDDSAGNSDVSIAPGGVSPASVVFDNSTRDYTLSGGPIMGSGTLEKRGTGTVTLANANTYTGATTVYAGTLALARTGSLKSEVTVNNGAVLDLSGTVPKVTLQPGGTLSAYSGSHITGDLLAEEAHLDFYLPTDVASRATILAVDGTADVTKSVVNVGIHIEGHASPLKVGDSVTLIDAAAITGTPLNALADGSGLHGVSVLYGFDIAVVGNTLRATVHKSDLDERTKALAEGFLAGTAFLNQGADFVADQGIDAAHRAQSGTGGGLAGFAALGGGKLRYESGSHIDVKGYTLVAGLATPVQLSAGVLTLGAFVEHGRGDYDTYNSFANAASVHGKGDADYTGGGLLARLAFNETAHGHWHVEASARLGNVKLDFVTHDLVDAFGKRAAYDSESRYTSAHVGLGYQWRIGERASLQLYGQYLWSRQEADNVKLSTGEPVEFPALDSHRSRLGTRWNHEFSKNSSFWLGAAWEHEYGSKAKAKLHDYQLDTPELKGDTGIVEAGFSLTPAAHPLTLDIGLQAYTGKREGVTGSLRANYRF
jgi:autotransporter-associated beta strand protein